MPVTRTVAAALVGVVVLGIVSVAARGDITVQSWSLTVMARVGSVGGEEDTVTGAGLPPSGWEHTHDVQHETAEWTSNAWTHYDFSADGDVGSFYFNFDHYRAGPEGSQAQSYGELEFTTPGEGLLYSLDGAYSLLWGDPSISLSVVLRDLTEGNNVFEDNQATFSTAGTLEGGHEYRLCYDYWINASASYVSDAYAEGFLEMNLTPIPAPGAALLGVIGLGTVGWARRRIA